MNTDNMQVVGETIDYGPCAFMDVFHPHKKFSSIDRQGRYAWGNQPQIAMWNLSRLAETLLPLFDAEEDKAIEVAEQAISSFKARFDAELTRRFRSKHGLLSEGSPDDGMLEATMISLTRGEVDFTLFFRELTRVAGGEDDSALRALFNEEKAAEEWLTKWRGWLEADGGDDAERVAHMRRHNPVFIPRNHRIEEAIVAGNSGDYAPFNRLVDVLARPFEEQPEHAELERAPAPEEVVCKTFCGT